MVGGMLSADFRAITYQAVAIFIKWTHVQFTILPRNAYDCVCVPGMVKVEIILPETIKVLSINRV